MKFIILTRQRMITLLCCLIAAALAVVITLQGIKAVTAFAAQNRNPICFVKTDEKKVAISFDCAWDDQETPKLLDILNRYNVKASFFVVGAWADRYPKSMQSIASAGHEIGNHSNTHPHMPKLSRNAMLAQIIDCNQKIKTITGTEPVLFRPPYGDCNAALVETAGSVRMYCIEWNIDSFDWKNPAPRQIVERVTTQVKPGSIILFHNGALNTVTALPEILSSLRAQGYAMVPVSQLIYKDGYTVDASGMQAKN